MLLALCTKCPAANRIQKLFWDEVEPTSERILIHMVIACYDVWSDLFNL